MINEDIIAQLGFTLLDDLIGDPSNIDPYAYPDLVNTSREYWKKYVDRNDMNAYLRIFSLFDLSFFKQVEQLLPARADKTVGVLVQPNILERSRDKVLTRISKESLTFETNLNIDDEELEAETKQIEPIIDVVDDFITGSTIQLEPTVNIKRELISGSTIQLEQSIDISLSELSGSTIQLEDTIDTSLTELSGSYRDLLTKISTDTYEITASAKELNAFIKKDKVIEADRRSFNSILIANRDPFKGSIYKRENILFNPDTNTYDITASTPYWESEAISPFISKSRLSEFKKIRYDFPFTEPVAYGFGGDGSQTLDTSQWTTKNVIQQSTTTGIGFKKAGPVTGSGIPGAINNWNANIMHNTVFLRKDSPFAKWNFKSIGSIGSVGNHPLGMMGWYPENSGSAGDGNNTPFTSYSSNLYILYQQGDRFLVYNGPKIPPDPVGRLNASSNALLSSITDANTGATPGTYTDIPLYQSSTSTGTGFGAYADITINGSGVISNITVNVYNPADNRALEVNDDSTARGIISHSQLDTSNTGWISNGAKQISGVSGDSSGTGATVRVNVSNGPTAPEYEVIVQKGGDNFEVGETVSLFDSSGTYFDDVIEFEVTAEMLVGTVRNGRGQGYKAGDKLTTDGNIIGIPPLPYELEIVLDAGDLVFVPQVNFQCDGYISAGDNWEANLMARPEGGAEISVFNRDTGDLAFSFDGYEESLAEKMRFGTAFYQADVDATIEFQDLVISTSRGLGYELRPAEFQDFLPRGMAAQRYDGTKISSPDFNIKSKDTPDGKPVVEIFESDGNKVIVTKSPGTEGNFEVR